MKWMIGALAALAIVAGCDKPKPADNPTSAFRVAMILPGSETDKGWNQMAKEGLDRIAKELGAQTKLVSKVKASEFASQIEYFAGEGFDVIICHGEEFQAAVKDAAPKHPKVSFIVGGCPTDIPGATAIEFDARDASFLTGLVAAHVSRTRTIAFVGAMAVPTLVACYDGMRDGAQSAGVSPTVNVLPPQWTDSWDSPTRAKEKAESVIGAGADVVYQNVDAAAVGVFEAVKQAAAKKDGAVFAFGCNSNQNHLAPQVILGSVVLDVPRAYLDLARDAQLGKLAKGHFKRGLRGGYVDLVLQEGHPILSADIKTKVDQARQQLVQKAAGSK